MQLQPPEAAVTVRVADGVTQTTEGSLVATDSALGPGPTDHPPGTS